MKRLVFLLIALICMAVSAKEYLFDTLMSDSRNLSGRVHRTLLIERSSGFPRICRLAPPTDREFSLLLEKYTGRITKIAVTYVEEIGTLFLVERENHSDGEESCERGVAYVYDGRKWTHGYYSMRTLGWNRGTDSVWDGFRFTRKQ